MKEKNRPLSMALEGLERELTRYQLESSKKVRFDIDSIDVELAVEFRDDSSGYSVPYVIAGAYTFSEKSKSDSDMLYYRRDEKGEPTVGIAPHKIKLSISPGSSGRSVSISDEKISEKWNKLSRG